MPSPDITRRWSRHPVDLPVRVVAVSRLPNLAVPGRATEISEGGMALYAGVPLQKGDLMEVEFQTPVATRVEAIVRDRIGFCYGLEFLVPLSAPTAPGRAKAGVYSKPSGVSTKARPAAKPAVRAKPVPTGSSSGKKLLNTDARELLATFLRRHDDFLQRKHKEVTRLQKEMDALRLATGLLAGRAELR